MRGVDRLVVFPPTHEVLDLSAEDFWAILRDEVRPAHMVEGGSFTFGKGRGGTIEKLREWAAEAGVERARGRAGRGRAARPDGGAGEQLADPVAAGERAGARCGDLPGSCVHARGVVVKGYQRGRTIGVPTANLDCGDQIVAGGGRLRGPVRDRRQGLPGGGEHRADGDVRRQAAAAGRGVPGRV